MSGTLFSAVTLKDAKGSDLQKALQLAENSVCPVWQMVKNNVEVASEFKIVAK